MVAVVNPSGLLENHADPEPLKFGNLNSRHGFRIGLSDWQVERAIFAVD